MELASGHTAREQDIKRLFAETFGASEGADEGKLIGDLARNMMASTRDEDLYVFCAYDGLTLVGCIMFSRLTYAQDDRVVFLLSPVAVNTDQQKQGVGQKLIAHGLAMLRQDGIDIAITYGDPNYYSKTGFHQITEEFAQAPLTLNLPHGWLGQSLSGTDQAPLIGASRCVEALNKPELW